MFQKDSIMLDWLSNMELFERSMKDCISYDSIREDVYLSKVPKDGATFLVRAFRKGEEVLSVWYFCNDRNKLPEHISREYAFMIHRELSHINYGLETHGELDDIEKITLN